MNFVHLISNSYRLTEHGMPPQRQAVQRWLQLNFSCAANKSRQRKHQAQRIEYWLGNLKEQINDKEELDYADFYLEMLNQEQDLEIAIKGTEHILKTLRKEKFTLESTSEFSFNPNQPNNAIWNIRIKKHS